MSPRLYVFVCLLALSSTGHTATLHVSPQGSDGNPCTSSAPCRTIQHGLSRLSSGDTVLIGAGTYAEGNLMPPSGVTLQGASGARPVLRPGSASVDTILHIQPGRQGITLDGLTLDGGGTTSFPIYADKGVERITVMNTEITGGLQSGMLIGGSHWEIRNNHIHHNGANCCATHSDDHGIYMSAAHSRIVGNRFDHNACYNVQVYGGSATDNVVEDNTFTASKCGVTLVYGGNHVFRNNIIFDDSTYYTDAGLAVFTPETLVEGNVFVRMNVVTVDRGQTASVQIRGNTVCQGQLLTPGATVSGNRFTCDGIDVEAEARKRGPGTSGSGGGRPPLPAPRNLRVVTID
jgi:parallel beta-helix repeat protein